MTLAETAERYAAKGRAIFPIAQRDKVPLTTDGFKSATAKPDQVLLWWTATPEANIGFVPGSVGLLVLDLDGPEATAEAQALGLLSEPTTCVATARGEHRYYRHPGGMIGNRKLSAHIDVRADAGYVLLPPSVHPSGAVYRWSDRSAPAVLPPAVVAMLAEPDSSPGLADELPGTIHEGGRNAWLTSLAGSARRRGATPEAILAMLQVENGARCRPPLSPRELASIAASVGKYPPVVSPQTEDSGGPLERTADRNSRIAQEAQGSLDREADLLSWGWRDFDHKFGGIVPGRMYVFGARPGNGKTLWMLNVLSHLWENRVPTLYFGTEMAPAELVKKWAAMRLDLEELAVFEGRMSDEERATLRAEIEALMDQDLVTFSTAPRLDIPRMAREIERAFDAKTGPPPRVLVLDHLHRLTQDREELEKLAKELADITVERHIAFLVAAQLNRDGSAGAFDLYLPPSLSRYKGSAAIEENAAVAFGIFRPLKHGNLKKKDRDQVERAERPISDFAEPNAFGIICTKHRYHGNAVGKMHTLILRGSKLEAKSFREEPVGWDEPRRAKEAPDD